MMQTFTRLCRQSRWYLGVSVAVFLNSALAYAAPVTALSYKPGTLDPIYYGPILCTYPDYTCITVKRGDTWEKMFPDERERDLVQRVNRTYNRLTLGQIVVVPKLLATATLLELAPFPHNIADTERQIIIDQDKLAWAAYDEEGQLVKWGPIASGRDKCSDSASSCRTLIGVYRVFSKEDSHCKSDVFPIGRGGAKMPYCMYFHKGFALHGADDMPGFRASHGCVRLFTEDAKWLNLNFVETSADANQHMGTKVVVRPVSAPSTFTRSVW
ncbi:MAG: L,D-transpeptidase [Legionellales bacterium]|nr:L,D-transpeptidase [Legionellales bacterium]